MKATKAKRFNEAEWTAEYHALREKIEPLHPDLKQCLDKRRGPHGYMLHHPLVIRLGVDQNKSAMHNRDYANKLAARDKALQKADWYSYVFLHERPYRLEAFSSISSKIDSDRTYWQLVASIWNDSENIWQHDEEWFAIWNWSYRDFKHLAMNIAERKAFNKLPDNLTIYRGIKARKNPNGMSWTLDRDKAIWFARRLRAAIKGMPILLTASANKSDVHALLLGRNQNEIVVDKVTIISRERVEPELDERKATP